MRIYEVSDRHWTGYRGRWRYRVTVREVIALDTRKVFSALFKRRSDAAAYASQSELHGPAGGARYLGSIGAREGEAFKVEVAP